MRKELANKIERAALESKATSGPGCVWPSGRSVCTIERRTRETIANFMNVVTNRLHQRLEECECDELPRSACGQRSR
jgi:hypothetical protein